MSRPPSLKHDPTYSHPKPHPHHHQHKRPKFDPRNPSTLLVEEHLNSSDALDDVVLDLDVIGTGTRKVKRGAIKIEGYESDSSEGGYEWKAESEGMKGGGADGDSDDMFAAGGEGDDEDSGKAARKKGKKQVTFLELDDIEGQESDNETDHVHIGYPGDKGKRKASAADLSDSGSDSDEAEAKVAEVVANLDPELGLGSLKKHAPKLEAFNMRSEMEEGRFDAAGNFIRKAVDVDAVHDSWLEGVSRKEMKRAKEAHEKREEEMRRRARAEDELLTSDMLNTLIIGMETGETVLEALARLGQERKKKVAQAEKEAGLSMGLTGGKKPPKWKTRKRNIAATEDNMVIEGATRESTSEEAKVYQVDKVYKDLIETLTGAADSLLTRGQLEIYDDTREQLMRQYRREAGEDWKPPQNRQQQPPAVSPPKPGDVNLEAKGDSSDIPNGLENTDNGVVEWEYRWTDGRDGGDVYGPYPTEHMKAWNHHGFFDGGGVEFRRIGESAAGWTLVADFD